MKKLTILSAVSILHLVGTLLWTAIYYNDIAHEGWGVLAMISLFFLGVVGLIASWITGLICKKFITNQPRRIQNTIEAAILAGFIVYVAIAY